MQFMVQQVLELAFFMCFLLLWLHLKKKIEKLKTADLAQSAIPTSRAAPVLTHISNETKSSKQTESIQLNASAPEALQDALLEQIIKQVRLLKQSSLAMGAVAASDVHVAEDAAACVDSSVSRVKNHNRRITDYSRSAWATTGILWTMLVLALLAFIASYLVIRLFPKF